MYIHIAIPFCYEDYNYGFDAFNKLYLFTNSIVK